MSKTVEFFFDFVSPTSYLAYKVLPKIAERAEAAVIWTPVFLGGVMQATGNRPPGAVDAKAKWMAEDLARWVRHYGIAYRRNSVFPMNTLTILRGAVAYEDDPVIRPYCDAMFDAIWTEDRDLSQRTEIDRVLERVGIDPETFHARVAEQDIKDQLKANTESAVARGVFGAPSFFVGGAMHFGQDRLWMVAEDLGIPAVEAFELILGGHEPALAEA